MLASHKRIQRSTRRRSPHAAPTPPCAGYGSRERQKRDGPARTWLKSLQLEVYAHPFELANYDSFEVRRSGPPPLPLSRGRRRRRRQQPQLLTRPPTPDRARKKLASLTEWDLRVIERTSQVPIVPAHRTRILSKSRDLAQVRARPAQQSPGRGRLSQGPTGAPGAAAG
jgi:hypothetical protein